MTREELIHKWNSYKGIIIYPTDNVKELINATIEELEKEPCEDCISRQTAIDAIKKYKIPSEDCVSSIDKVFNDGIETAIAEIGHNVPSVNPKEPKTGDWETEKKGTFGIFYRCSRCHELYHAKTNYCPNCGAKMESEE